jgi:hypothetical protein
MALPFEFLYPIIHRYIKAKVMPRLAIRRQVDEPVRNLSVRRPCGVEVDCYRLDQARE